TNALIGQVTTEIGSAAFAGLNSVKIQREHPQLLRASGGCFADRRGSRIGSRWPRCGSAELRRGRPVPAGVPEYANAAVEHATAPTGKARVRARIKMPDASGLAYGGALYARPRALVSFNSTVAVWRLLAWRFVDIAAVVIAMVLHA